MGAISNWLRLAVSGVLLLATGCYELGRSSGGGQLKSVPQTRRVNPADVQLPPGYRIDAVAEGLNFPTGVCFDDQRRAYVVEAGYSYGEVWATPRLLRIDGNGKTTEIARGNAPPWTGVAFANGAFYIAEGGEAGGGRIARVTADGHVTTLAQNLPSMGDHHTNGPAVGPDGNVYFSIGTATNSGVVGEDNFNFGWAKRHPEFHDICGPGWARCRGSRRIASPMSNWTPSWCT